MAEEAQKNRKSDDLPDAVLDILEGASKWPEYKKFREAMELPVEEDPGHGKFIAAIGALNKKSGEAFAGQEHGPENALLLVEALNRKAMQENARAATAVPVSEEVTAALQAAKMWPEFKRYEKAVTKDDNLDEFQAAAMSLNARCMEHFDDHKERSSLGSELLVQLNEAVNKPQLGVRITS